jgi:DNA polymerase I
MSTIDCVCCKGKAKPVGATGHWFCQKRKGLMPTVLNDILKKRIAVKQEMKKFNKNSLEYKMLDSRQYALKILANSAYGYLAYRGSRWYTREGARSVTALGRMYIQNIIDLAESFGLKAIYGDTDSLFVVAEKGDVKDTAKEFMKKVNDELPGVMELEFEGVYKRGIFVSKKRYAMIDDAGKMHIKGLEFVRKDWSPIAKDTQKRVLESLLQEGSPEKAFEIVRKVIKRLSEGEVKKEELAVYTDLTRPLEKYAVTAPHIAVAKKMKQKGEDVRTGTTVGYIITRGGGLISDRARHVDEVNVKDIDRNYYIQNQIVPAVSRVMAALGYKEEDLLGKKQTKLTGFG